MFTMTVTRILYFLAFYNVLWSVIRANQPDGYLGCFDDFELKSLHNRKNMYTDSNDGDKCKAECKKYYKRYAGTKGWWCVCGSGFVQYMKRSSKECNEPCSGNSREICGGSFEGNYYNRISLYDTWLCITSPCQNGATCTDIDAESYNCCCSVGWTGRFFNETVVTSNSTMISSSSAQDIGSLTTQTVSSTTYTEPQSPNIQATGSSTEAAQPSEIKLEIYIAVPVSTVVLIVFVLIMAVLILRRKPNQNDNGLQATYQTSANVAAGDNDQNYDAIDRTGVKDQNYDAIDRTGDKDHNYDAVDRTGDNDHNYDAFDRTGHNDHNYAGIDRTGDKDNKVDAIDQTGGDDHNYSNIDQTELEDRNYSNVDRSDSGSAIHNDDRLNLQITA